ncbi:GNAT family N-acetyltransferase [Halosimplex litoreum]|uniref:GNAT family N-acetyltransferase n=1 Tax=Halosimplex litoreum TaxID=1198301 RepID=A0A7U3WBA9_9EURY|nr:GNAT family protein [Halosimplex litoreum]QPV64904.1 GNAT family N-acetyltransferase [Halosimplex litoreum]
MPGPVFLRGDRVTLRPPEDEDLDFLQRNHNDPAVRRSMPRVHPQNREATREEYVEGGDGTVGLLVCDGDGANPDRLGFCALFDIERTSGRGEVGAWLAPEARGEGHATEALSLLVDYAFAERRLERLNAGRLATNGRSAALLDRLGFVAEGRRRGYYFVGGERVDRVEYGLLGDEWDGA